MGTPEFVSLFRWAERIGVLVNMLDGDRPSTILSSKEMGDKIHSDNSISGVGVGGYCSGHTVPQENNNRITRELGANYGSYSKDISSGSFTAVLETP